MASLTQSQRKCFRAELVESLAKSSTRNITAVLLELTPPFQYANLPYVVLLSLSTIPTRRGVEGYITRVRNPEAARRCALAMTRSFGDISFKHVGVCAVPEIQEVELDYRHAYILLCSDGVTGALSDRRVSEIINDNRMGTSQQVTDAIIEEARACWDCGEFDMDDITVIFSWLLVDKKMDDFRESDIFGPSLSTIMRSLGTKKLSSSQWPPKAAYSTSVPIPMVNDHVGNDQMAIPKGNLIRMRSTPMTREKDADDITRQLSRELRLENKLGRSRGVLKRYR